METAPSDDRTSGPGPGRPRRLSAATLTVPPTEAAHRAGGDPAPDPADAAPRPSRRTSAVAARPAETRSDLPGALSAVILCFSGLAVFGADRAELALIFDTLWGITILVALWRRPVRFNLFQVRTLPVLAGLFVALLAWVLVSLTPLMPSPPGNAWSWVGGGAGTIDKAMTLVELTKLIGLAAAFSAGVVLADTDRRAELTLRFLCTAGALFAVFSLLQHVVTPTRVLGAAKLMFQDRLTGPFLSANVAAGFFGSLAVLNLATLEAGPQVHASRTAGDVRFILRYGALVLIFACLVLTASRMGAIAVMGGLIVSFGLSFWKERDVAVSLRSRAVVRLVVFGVFLLLAVAGQLLITRFNQVDNGFSGRNVLFLEHLNAFLASPVTGHGLGSFGAVNDQLVTPENFYELWYIRAAHNVYLQWLEETGVVGALLMFAVIAVIHWEILKGHNARQSLVWLMRGVLGFSAVLLLQSLGDFTLQTPAIALMWALLLGLGYRVATGGSRAAEREAVLPPLWVQRAAFWAPIGIAVVAEVSALLVLWGASRKAAEDGFPLALRSAYEQAALHRLSVNAPGSREAARTDTLAALRQSPTDAYAWTMLAYLDTDAARAIEDLERSYLGAPLAPNLVRWRAQLAADRWDQLSPELRAKVMEELRIERKLDGFDVWLNGLLSRYHDTSFGLALSLALQNWNSTTD
jgi:O-antigen ligase